jgi:hypothetical protein
VYREAMAMAIVFVPTIRTVLAADSATRPASRPAPEAQAANVGPCAWAESEPAVADAAPAPERCLTRRAALGVVIVLCCGFSYSIGWQNGWSAGTVGADARFNALNAELLENVRENDAAERSAEAAQSGGPEADRAAMESAAAVHSSSADGRW